MPPESNLSEMRSSSDPSPRTGLDFLRARWPFFIAALLGFAYALAMPRFMGPDESAHLAYVVALSQGHWPLMPPDQSINFSTGATYQAQHPPLFYLLATPLFRLFGGDLNIGLYLLRLLGVGCLLVSVWLVGRIAAQLLSPRAAHRAQGLAATNPVLVYVCAMANNEALAVALALACVWMALQFQQKGAPRFLIAAILCGGLGLLTKLTALGDVLAASLIATQVPFLRTNAPSHDGALTHDGALNGALILQDESSGEAPAARRRWWAAAIVLVGCGLLWVPWMLLMLRNYGTLSPQLFHPIFAGGFGNLLLFPVDALQAAAATLGEYALGLGLPMWLMHVAALEYVFMGIGALIGAWIAWASLRSAKWRFVAVSYFCGYAMVLMQAYFRDVDAVLSASRYVPAAMPLVAMMALSQLENRSARLQRVACAVWLIGAFLVHGYIFKFFLLP